MAQVTSGSFTTSAYSGRSIKFSWSLKSQSIKDNTSTIEWTFAGSGTGTSWFYTQNSYLNINGARVYTQNGTAQLAPGTVLASGTTTIAHGNDGKKTFNANGGGGVYAYSTIQTGSGSWELPQIPRAAALTTAPHFTDEDNPTITYSNPASSAVSSLKACIANSTGTVVYADYRDIPINGTSYTFNLTDEERNNLRWATINSPNLTVKFYVTTVIGGNTYYSTLDKIMTITNANPTIQATAYDVGTASTALTGDNTSIIKGYNYISFSQIATAYKGASIKKQSVNCGGQVITGGSGTLVNVESGELLFSATDSRGYTTTQALNLKVIDYIKLTCNLEVKKLNAEGQTSITVHGNYFNGSFGLQNNELTILYRYQKEGEDFTEWMAAPVELDGNTYSTKVDFIGLDYRSPYTFQAKAKDKVLEISASEQKIKSIPTFDWGQDDFKFNVDVFDKNGAMLGTELTAKDYEAVFKSGKSLLETGWVTITPSAPSTPTGIFLTFKKHYEKIPVVLVTASSGVIGSQVLGVSTNGTTTDGVNIVLNRTNTTPTSIYYFVFGEVYE